MAQWFDPLLMAVLALNFYALGVSRVRAVVRAVAVQGALIGLLPLVVHPEVGFHAVVLAGGSVLIKGFLIPALLFYAMREVNVQHEVRPIINYIPSLLLGAVGTGLALMFADTLPLVEGHARSLLIPTALSTVLTGFLILTTRKVAINQVLGYVVLENGIFTFGMLLLQAMPFMVEAGVLLDLFTGVFVMGIIIHHINREFASVDTELLSELKEENAWQ